MSNSGGEEGVIDQRREQILKLVTRAFFKELRRYGIKEDEIVRVTSRRGSVTVPIHIDPDLKPGLVFMTFHAVEEVDTNILTINATDPKSGTAEFKAAAVRIEKISDIAAE